MAVSQFSLSKSFSAEIAEDRRTRKEGQQIQLRTLLGVWSRMNSLKSRAMNCGPFVGDDSRLRFRVLLLGSLLHFQVRRDRFMKQMQMMCFGFALCCSVFTEAQVSGSGTTNYIPVFTGSTTPRSFSTTACDAQPCLCNSRSAIMAESSSSFHFGTLVLRFEPPSSLTSRFCPQVVVPHRSFCVFSLS